MSRAPGTADSSGTVRSRPAEPLRAQDRPRPAGPTAPPFRTRPATPAAGEPWTDDPYAEALRTGRGPLFLRRVGEPRSLLPLDVERWSSAPDAADSVALLRCHGPVLDIGCGPGRLVAALAAQGRPALGIDVSPAAVARTRRTGGTALRRCVFQHVPAEGRWGTTLLVDGNIGIGGDPHALLRRVLQLVAPGGRLVAEAAPQEVDERLTVRVEDAHGRHGRPFPWARLGVGALLRVAEASGWTPVAQWTVCSRPFVELSRPGRSRTRPAPLAAAAAQAGPPRESGAARA